MHGDPNEKANKQAPGALSDSSQRCAMNVKMAKTLSKFLEFLKEYQRLRAAPNLPICNFGLGGVDISYQLFASSAI